MALFLFNRHQVFLRAELSAKKVFETINCCSTRKMTQTLARDIPIHRNIIRIWRRNLLAKHGSKFKIDQTKKKKLTMVQ